MTARTCWLALVLVVAPATAHAFSDPALFGTPAIGGGGGGKYFTGSRVDGYACNVCHQGGVAPHVVIEGVPDTLVSGTRYTLTVRWDHPNFAQGVQLELLTTTGAHPSVEVTPEAMLPPESRCEQVPTGTSAIYTVDVGPRRIVGVQDCGASMVAVSFVAPPDEQVELAIAAVRSDGSSTADGDGTFELRTTLGQHLASSSGAGCGVPPGGSSLTFGLVASAIAYGARRRRPVIRARRRSAR